MISVELVEGELEILGLLPDSSNYTFLARLARDEEALVVYKPRRGEAPLWDFPSGTLCNREVAAYLVSNLGGWGHVPPTVLRDGPFGPGAVQTFIPHDPAYNAFNLAADHEDELKQIALFDLVANNADRKAGHVLLGDDGRLWAVDHGLCFHPHTKLRTVLWDYVGDPIPAVGLEAVNKLCEAVSGSKPLQELLFQEEIDALLKRAEAVLFSKVFPPPGPGRPYPWPPI